MTEEAIWNDIPERLKYNHYDEKDSDDGSPGSPRGLKPGPYEDSDDISVQERRKQEDLERRYQELKGDRNIISEEEQTTKPPVISEDDEPVAKTAEIGIQVDSAQPEMPLTTFDPIANPQQY